MNITMQNLERLSLAEMKEFVGEPEGLLLDGSAGGDVWLHRRNAEETAVSEVEQRTKRYCAPTSDLKEFVGEPEGLLLDGSAGGDVWLHRRNAEETAVSEVEQRTKRYCAPI